MVSFMFAAMLSRRSTPQLIRTLQVQMNGLWVKVSHKRRYLVWSSTYRVYIYIHTRTHTHKHTHTHVCIYIYIYIWGSIWNHQPTGVEHSCAVLRHPRCIKGIFAGWFPAPLASFLHAISKLHQGELFLLASQGVFSMWGLSCPKGNQPKLRRAY